MGTRPWSGQDYVQENASHPAVYISWEDVQQFIHTLNQSEGRNVYRLPTEAEWEYACRAGTSTRWPFGEDESQLETYAWYGNNAWNIGEKYAHAVGQKRPNPWGLHDMLGNVYEWCQDWYGSYSSGSQADPTGATTGSLRVFRGGCFGGTARGARPAGRSYGSPGGRNNNLGARLLSTGSVAGEGRR
ncbi:MAG: formylglycine-generating enzyme family protein [Acidobacteriota bacterium]